MEVSKCLERKDGVKMTIIPKKSDIKKGDPVLITKDLTLADKIREGENGRRKKRN